MDYATEKWKREAELLGEFLLAADEEFRDEVQELVNAMFSRFEEAITERLLAIGRNPVAEAILMADAYFCEEKNADVLRRTIKRAQEIEDSDQYWIAKRQ